jgi:hypothetical protein
MNAHPESEQKIAGIISSLFLIRDDSKYKKTHFCLKEFVETLKELCDFEYAGIIRYSRINNVINFIYPSLSKIKEWSFTDQWKNQVMLFFNENPDAKYFHYDAWYRISKNMADDSDNFFIISVTPFASNFVQNEELFLFLGGPLDIFESSHPLNSRTEELPLLSLITWWASHISHNRNLLLDAVSTISNVNINKGEREKGYLLANNALRESLNLFKRDEIILTARECVRIPDNKGVGIINDISSRLENFHECAPPHWPNCLQKDKSLRERDIIEILIKWSWWSGISPFDIGDYRKESGGLRADITSPYLKSFSSDVKVLAKHAYEIIQPESLSDLDLLRFFFAKTVLPVNKDGPSIETGYCVDKTLSDDEVSQSLHHFSAIGHYLFGNLPLEEETIRSIMWLISEYAHTTLEVPRRIDLKAHLLLAARGEPALHTLRHFYRDHFYHALEVCFMGHFLLEMEVPYKGDVIPFWQLIAQDKYDKQQVLRIWYIASLLHDIGYYIELQKSIIEVISFFDNSPFLNEFKNSLQKTLQELSQKIGDQNFVCYTTLDKPGEDHGIIGAHHLYYLLKQISKEISDPDLTKEYAAAIRAIALHNSRRQTVSFRQDSFAFLLIICDTIQEWKRPRFNYALAPSEFLNRMINNSSSNSINEGPQKEIGINNVEFNKNNNVFGSKEPNIQFKLAFDHSIQINSGVFNLWIDATCNLQRLSFDGLPDEFDFQIEFITPFYRNSDGGVYQQLYRLRDAANETHIEFLKDWFPNSSNGNNIMTNGAVSYCISEKEGNEHLTLHLRELSKKHRVTKDIADFRERLSKWRFFNDDREYKGDYAVPEKPS